MTRALVGALLPALLVTAGCSRKTSLSFEAPVRVDDAPAGRGSSEPMAAAGPGGRVTVTWIDWTPRPQVRFAVSTNGGASFGASEPVDADDDAHPEGQADPAVRRRPNGDLVLAWIACAPHSAPLGGRACDVRVRAGADAPVTVSGPAKRYRDRPWLLGREVKLTWNEQSEEGRDSFVVTDPRFVRERTLPDRVAMTPPSGDSVLLVDRAASTATTFALRYGDESYTVPRAAVLLDYAYGAVSGDWVLLPRGTGKDNDFTVRKAAREIGTLRTPKGRRVGLVAIESHGATAVAAWLEERKDGWRVVARALGPGARIGPPTDVSAPFRFVPASLDRNIGDHLGVAIAGEHVWITWSDTTSGDADIRIAKARLPRVM